MPRSNKLSFIAAFFLLCGHAPALAQSVTPAACYISGSSVVCPNGTLTPSGAPGGSNTQVQFNDSSAFGGSSLFTFNKTTGNVTFNNYFATAQSTVSAGGTTVLTASSGRYQALTGSSSQTFQLPDATTLQIGMIYAFNNNSSGSLIITNAGGTTLYTVPAGGLVQGGPTSISTANGSWDWHPAPPSTVTWGSGTTGFVMNTALSTTPAIGAGTPSGTSPVFIPRRDALTTGIGAQAAGNLSLVAAGTETARVTSTGVKIGAGSEITSSGAGGALAAVAFSGSASDLSTGTVPAGRLYNGLGTRYVLLSADLNTTSDQAVTITLPAGVTNYRANYVALSNPSTSMTTAVCGFWTGAGKTGTTLIGTGATGVAMSGLTTNTAGSAGSMIILSPNNVNTAMYNSTTIYFACSTAQGGAATADVTIGLQALN